MRALIPYFDGFTSVFLGGVRLISELTEASAHCIEETSCTTSYVVFSLKNAEFCHNYN